MRLCSCPEEHRSDCANAPRLPSDILDLHQAVRSAPVEGAAPAGSVHETEDDYGKDAVVAHVLRECGFRVGDADVAAWTIRQRAEAVAWLEAGQYPPPRCDEPAPDWLLALSEDERVIDVDEDDLPFDPDWRSPPGDSIAHWLQERGRTAAFLAQESTIAYGHLIDLIQGEAALTEDDAEKLGKTLGPNAGFWRRREAHYRAPRPETDTPAPAAPSEPGTDGIDRTHLDPQRNPALMQDIAPVFPFLPHDLVRCAERPGYWIVDQLRPDPLEEEGLDGEAVLFLALVPLADDTLRRVYPAQQTRCVVPAEVCTALDEDALDEAAHQIRATLALAEAQAETRLRRLETLRRLLPPHRSRAAGRGEREKPGYATGSGEGLPASPSALADRSPATTGTALDCPKGMGNGSVSSDEEG